MKAVIVNVDQKELDKPTLCKFQQVCTIVLSQDLKTPLLEAKHS